MPQTESSESDKKPKNKKFFPGGFWWIVLGAATLSSVAVYLSRAFSRETEQYTFIAQAILNILIFAAILIQALIYRRQWDVMAESNELARHTLYISNRPYVVVPRIKVNLPLEAGKIIVYQTIVENRGETPAYETEFMMFIDVEAYLLPEKPSYRSVRTRTSKVTMAQGTRMKGKQTDTIDVLTQEQIDLIKDGKLFVYIYGFVKYQEAFTDKTHRTRFYLIYDPDEKRFTRGGHHNDSD